MGCKLKHYCTEKENNQQTEKANYRMKENIHRPYTSDKGLISKIYKKSL